MTVIYKWWEIKDVYKKYSKKAISANPERNFQNFHLRANHDGISGRC